MSVEGKVVLITGAGRGIGRGIALAFGAAGASVVVAERDEPDGRSVVQEIQGTGGAALFVRCDVSRREDVYGAVKAAADHFGGLDVLVNNAVALTPNVLLEDKTDEMLELTISTGMWGTWWGMRAALPEFQKRGGGRIINFYSGDAESGAWLHSDYNASKSAVLGLTRSAAAEWGRYNVLVNAICPAAKGTTYHLLEAQNPRFLDRWLRGNPLGRMGEPDKDIAPVVLFLASEASRYITGEMIHVDGGQHLARSSSKPESIGSAPPPE